MLCDKTKQCTADILTPHERTINPVFWHQPWLVGDALFRLKFAFKVTHPFEKCRLRQIFAHNVSTERYRGKGSIMTNRKSTTGLIFQRAVDGVRIHVAYTLPLSPPNGSSKTIFCFLIKLNFVRIKSATTFLRVKTSSSKVVIITIPHLTDHIIAKRNPST